MPITAPTTIYSVAYWYQTEPHAPFPQLPPAGASAFPKIYPVGGPGNAGSKGATLCHGFARISRINPESGKLHAMARE